MSSHSDKEDISELEDPVHDTSILEELFYKGLVSIQGKAQPASDLQFVTGCDTVFLVALYIFLKIIIK